MSHSLKHFEQIAMRMELNHPLSKLTASENLGRKIRRNENPLPSAHFLARPNQRFPSICSNLARKKNLNATRAMLAPPIKPRRKNTRIVQHQAIALLNIGRKIAEHAILPGAGRAIDYQHSRAVAFGKRLLRNQFFR